MGVTIIGFVDLQIKDNKHWKDGGNYKEDGVLKVKQNNAEIHLVAIDGTFRQLFFAENSIIRIVGNTIWFDSKDSDYLITDHDKKLSDNPKINDFGK